MNANRKHNSVWQFLTINLNNNNICICITCDYRLLHGNNYKGKGIAVHYPVQEIRFRVGFKKICHPMAYISILTTVIVLL